MKNNKRYFLLVVLILLHHVITCSCYTLHNRKIVETIKHNNRKQHHQQLQRKIKKFPLCKLHSQKSSTSEEKEKTISSKKWDYMYLLLLEIQQQEVNCNVPLSYITKNGKKLGTWLERQRINRRNGKLNEDREHKLDNIGIIWDHTGSWESTYSLLLEFHQREGDCNVPPRYVTQDGRKLGTWLTNQRSNHRKGKLSKERAQKLDKVGIVWDPLKKKEKLAG
eukprot:CAMPEP_0194178538 /NCGR_PEP_ID=MMETSP0154-20130528/12102_1 /TAXON_ID=1049557 /ORGANISM="Thalassiothrix antarctica, Strain L6-D1" /LENGTH=221 /DNA_ID=CAMNT_0038893509 /DNA_START=42 /DNA_END=707 /DNA_ORIENTATION=-